jgi:hypothetical protein
VLGYGGLGYLQCPGHGVDAHGFLLELLDDLYSLVHGEQLEQFGRFFHLFSF